VNEKGKKYMTVIKWTPWQDPFQEFEKILQEWPGYTNLQSFVPAVDVYQDDDNVFVETPLPGIDIKDVNIAIANDILTITGRSEHKSEVDEKDYYRKEVRSGNFHRSLALPTSVNGDRAEATYKDGVLKIIIPKEEKIKPKKINIKIN
jgi:HSP20 family protein